MTGYVDAAAEAVRDERSGLWKRPGTIDDFIIGERRQYLALEPAADDALLDVGGCIGSVAAEFAGRVSAVTSFEPDPDNFALLRRNVAGHANVTAFNAAVTPTGGDVTLYRNVGKNKGMHSLVPHRGREELTVPSFAFAELLERYRPTLLKVDIEGGEYALAAELGSLPGHVRGIAMELHLTRKAWRERDAPAMIGALAAQGFMPVRPPRVGEKNWTTMAVWLRPRR